MSQNANRRPGSPEGPPSRRGFLGVVAGVAAAIGALIGVPVGGLFAAPLFRKGGVGPDEGQWVPLGPAEQFGEEVTSRTYQFAREDGWYKASRTRRVAVRKVGEGKFQVLSTVCPHARCTVSWQADQKRFYCPCHDGVFDIDGKQVSGPPPAPLDRLEARVNPEGQLEVREV